MAAAQSMNCTEPEWKDYDFETEIERLATLLHQIIIALNENIFVAPDDRRYIQDTVTEYMKSIAQTRSDISNLLYD